MFANKSNGVTEYRKNIEISYWNTERACALGELEKHIIYLNANLSLIWASQVAQW